MNSRPTLTGWLVLVAITVGMNTLGNDREYRQIAGLTLTTQLLSINACKAADGVYVEQLALRAQYANGSESPVRLSVHGQPPAAIYIGDSALDLKNNKLQYGATTFYLPSEESSERRRSEKMLAPGGTLDFETGVTLFITPRGIRRKAGTINSGTYWLQVQMLTVGEELAAKGNAGRGPSAISTLSAPMQFATADEESTPECPIIGFHRDKQSDVIK